MSKEPTLPIRQNGKQHGIIVKNVVIPLLLLQKRSFILKSD